MWIGRGMVSPPLRLLLLPLFLFPTFSVTGSPPFNDDVATMEALSDALGMWRMTVVSCPRRIRDFKNVTRATMRFSTGKGVWLDAGGGFVCADDKAVRVKTVKMLRQNHVGVQCPWLVAYSDDTVGAELEKNLRVGLNRQIYLFNRNDGNLSEVYTVGNSQKVSLIGNMSPDLKFTFSNTDSLVVRRSNLFGQELRVMVHDQPPYLHTHLPKGSSRNVTTASGDVLEIVPVDKIHGIFYSLIRDVGIEMNATLTLYRRFDGQWGTRGPNNTLTGMFSNVLKGEADLIAASVTMRVYRQRAMDFLIPLGTETYAIFIKRVISEDLDWTLYANPFKWEVWKFLLLYSLAITAAIEVFQVATNRNRMRQREEVFKNTNRFLIFVRDLLYAYWISFRSNFGGEPPPNTDLSATSMRILFFAIFLVSNTVFLCYRAAFTSYLADRRLKMPFDSLRELLHSDYKLTVVGTGLTGTLFQDAKNGSVFYDLASQFTPESTFRTFDDAMANLLREPRAAFADIAESVFAMESARCSVLMPWKTDYPNLLAMAVPKRSQYYDALRYQTLRQMEVGSFNLLNARLKRNRPDCGVGQEISLSLEKLVSLFGILGLGFVIAVGVFWAEKCIGLGVEFKEKKELSFSRHCTARRRSI